LKLSPQQFWFAEVLLTKRFVEAAKSFSQIDMKTKGRKEPVKRVIFETSVFYISGFFFEHSTFESVGVSQNQ